MDAEKLKQANLLQGTIDELNSELKTLQFNSTTFMYPLQVKLCYLGDEGYREVIELMTKHMTARRDQAKADFAAL